MFKEILEWFNNERKKFCKVYREDPVKECDLYKDKNCVFVDGPFCDFPKCSMLKKYKEMDINVLSHNLFDEYCKSNEINDDNVETHKDKAFISIIGTPEVLEYYLKEPYTEHWFKKNHSNVINLEFDDCSEDKEHKYTNGYGEEVTIHAYTMNEKQAEELYDFIEKNKGKTFIIHCRAGLSRSIGVGKYILGFIDGYENCKGKGHIDRITSYNSNTSSMLAKVWYKKHKIFQ